MLREVRVERVDHDDEGDVAVEVGGAAVEHEPAAPLGARRGALVRQLVSESMLLAVLGGGVGLLLAEWTLRAVVGFGTDMIPRLAEVRIDSLALGFAVIGLALAGLAIAVAGALAPATWASRYRTAAALRTE